MTTRTLECRIKDHRKTYNNTNSRMYNFKIYQAMRKYGIENFHFAILEECQNDKLEQREKYYIEKNNTIEDGYNEALGGKGKCLWTNKHLEACKILYDNGWLLQDIAFVLKSNAKTVGKKLRDKYNINTKENNDKNKSFLYVGIKDNEVIKFLSLREAANYIISNNMSKSKNHNCVQSKIHMSVKNKNRTAYGYSWSMVNTL